MGQLTLGRGNDVGIGVILGERPQHLGYKNEVTRTEIGDNNIFREHTTVHRGTAATGVTTIGNNNFLMAHSHVAHDCRVANHTTIVHGSLLGGHCVLEDGALLAGNAAMHQFTRMGRLSLLSGLSSITMDLPPFMMAWGRNNVIGINRIGMRRAGMNVGQIRVVQKAFQIIYRGGLIQKLALEKVEQELGDHPVAMEMLTFIRGSKRGIIGPRVGDDREMAEAA
jgi:UDP-N-acetylglucosamine acyltransferase